MAANSVTGSVGWMDLTVENADEVAQFYEQVVGWERQGIDMGGYEDWCVGPPGASAPAGGICHARGPNVGIPPAWLVYVSVSDLESSLEKCTRLGGKVVCPLRNMGQFGTMAVIADPAGAVMALIQPPSERSTANDLAQD